MKSKVFSEAVWSEDPTEITVAGRHVQGHAEFDANRGIDVIIPLGSLLHANREDGIAVQYRRLASDCIYGFTQDGYYMTVPDVCARKGKTSYPGFESQILHGSELYVSRKLVGARPRIRSLVFGILGLREWVGINPISESIKYDESHSVETMTYEFASEDIPEILLYDEGGIRASVEFNWTSRGGRIPIYEHAFSSDYMVSLSFDCPVMLQDALNEWAFPLRGFLSFCMGFFGTVTSISFTTDEGVRAEYYLPLVEGKEPGSTEFNRIPFGWRANRERIPSMLRAWLGFEGYAKEAATRVVSLTADWTLPLEISFLATAQAFEAVSRVGRQSCEMDHEVFSRRVETIAGAVTDEELRNWLRQKMKYSNYRSANSLAKAQLKDLGLFAKYLGPNQRAFLREHRDTRNYCTHLNAEGKRRVLHGEQLLANADATYMLLYGSICMLLGISPDVLIEVLKKTWFGTDRLNRSRKQYGL